MRLRSHLIGLVIIALVPVLTFTTILIVQSAREQRAALGRGLQETARALAATVDEHVSNTLTALRALATSEHLDSGDLEAFHRQAERAVPSQEGWYTVVLLDRRGQQLLNTLRPFGAPLPSSAGREYFKQVIATGKPAISDLLTGKTPEEVSIVVAIPVQRQDGLRYVLAAGLDVLLLSRILAQQRLPPDWTGAVLDRHRTIIARTRTTDQFIGQPAPPVLARTTAQSLEGTYWDVTKAGARVYGAFSQAPLTGWTVALGVPAAAARLSSNWSLWAMVGGGALFLLAGGGLALFFGRHIAAPIVALSSWARRLERGEPPEFPHPSSVLEVNDLARALQRASAARGRAEEELRESEARFRVLADTAPVMVWMAGADGRRTFLNQRWLDFTGRTMEQELGEGWAEGVQREDLDRCLATYRCAFASPRPFRMEYRLRRADGASRWVLDNGIPRYSADGSFSGFIGSCIDITDRKEAEAGLSRLAAIVESSEDAIITKSLEGVVLSWNAGAERMYGYAAQEVVGRSIALVVPPGRQSELEDILDRVRRGERIAPFETQRMAKDGRQIEVSVSISPIRGANGQIMAASAIAREITERKRAQAERDRLLLQEQGARREAEAANRAKDEFLAALSHELRAPLNAILMWTQLLRVSRADAETAERALATIERNTKAQAQLIEDLLDVSRIVAGKLRLDLQRVDLAGVIESALDVVRPTAESKGVRLASVLDPGVGRVAGDPQRLHQILWNLLANAVKFTPAGGRAEVRLDRAGSHARIRISDTGQGIRPEFLPHVFERFRQFDASTTRAHGGLGLGLAIVHHLVELHGGTVQADSAGEGRGATFTVLLPLALDLPEAADADQTTLTDLCRRRALAGVRVLVVDDEKETRDVLAVALERCGAEVAASGSAAEALETLERAIPDVLVSDLAMPKEDGYSLLRRLRTRDPARGGRLPAVAVSAYARPVDRERALGAGFQRHLAKPVDPVELATAIAELLGLPGTA